MTTSRWALALGVLLVFSFAAQADETDSFTDRNIPLKDSLDVLDAHVNDLMRQSVSVANSKRKSAKPCDTRRLFRDLREAISGSYHAKPVGIPHSKFEKWIDESSGIDRRHLDPRKSIYGTKNYSNIVRILNPFDHHVIWLADGINLGGNYVGLDKLNHFIREGQVFFETTQKHRGDVVAGFEEGLKGTWSEAGLKGMTLNGIFSWADLASAYSGYVFYERLYSINRPDSYLSCDTKTGEFSLKKPFSFKEANLVNASWDEAINCSRFHPEVQESVDKGLAKLGLKCPVDQAACRSLANLPYAKYYVNPNCLGSAEKSEAAPESSPPSEAAH